jgi:hypothetical protein
MKPGPAVFLENRLLVCSGMSGTDPPESPVIRQIDELLTEAKSIRERFAAALRRIQERPFWPDRRHTLEPHHEPERRKW